MVKFSYLTISVRIYIVFRRLLQWIVWIENVDWNLGQQQDTEHIHTVRAWLI